MQKDRFVALVGAALVVVAGASACSANPEIKSEKAARVVIGDDTFSTGAISCTQQEMYRSIEIRQVGSRIEAVVLINRDKVIPQWVKIRDFGGFTGSFWKGGVGEANADFSQRKFTITGSAYGINRSNPNKVVTTDFKIAAEC